MNHPFTSRHRKTLSHNLFIIIRCIAAYKVFINITLTLVHSARRYSSGNVYLFIFALTVYIIYSATQIWVAAVRYDEVVTEKYSITFAVKHLATTSVLEKR